MRNIWTKYAHISRRRGRTGEGYGRKKMILVKISFIWKNKEGDFEARVTF